MGKYTKKPLSRTTHSLYQNIIWISICYALIGRTSRMLHIQGVKGEAVVNYCEPLTTPKMGCHRLSRRVNKMEIK